VGWRHRDRSALHRRGLRLPVRVEVDWPRQANPLGLAGSLDHPGGSRWRGLWFNAQQKEREQQIANEKAQDEALESYLGQMSQLLTDEKRPLARSQPGDNLSAVARARTLSVLPRLGGNRKRSVVEFLYESGLLFKDRIVFPITGADLSGAYLPGRLLEKANLIDARLQRAYLVGARLREADLLFAKLMEANLEGANLSGARLFRAMLRGANLHGADLTGATGITNEELEQQAYSLKGATMPNGQKYEDWLKDQEGRNEDGANK
jgi:hypothetical protein